MLHKSLQYVPIAIIFFFAVSFWRDGHTEGVYILGLAGLGLLLLNGLLHINRIRDKILVYRKHIGLVASVIIISIGAYSLVIGNIYDGIFYVLLGMTFLFMEVLKGKWGLICSTVVLVLAIGLLILQEINKDTPHAFGKETGLHPGVENALSRLASIPPNTLPVLAHRSEVPLMYLQ